MTKKLLVLFIMVFIVNGCNSDKNKYLKIYTELNVLPIQAHRGGGLNKPENTLETFIVTWKQGIIPEADIRTTSDDVIICMHDRTPKRLAPNAPDSLIGKKFSEMTLKEVKTLDVGSFRGGIKEAVPTLEEVFAAMKGHPERFIYLDYKKIDLDRLSNLVKKYGLEKQVIFTSRYHKLIREWNKHIPGSLSLCWIGGSQENIEKTFSELRKNNFEGITTIQIHVKKVKNKKGVFTPSPDYLKERMNEVNKKGILFQVLPLKIKDKDIYDQLLKLGIRSFATDYPEMTIKYYKEFLKQQ